MSDRFNEIDSSLRALLSKLFIKYGTNINLDKIEPELNMEIDNHFDDIYSKLPLDRYLKKILIPYKVGDKYRVQLIVGVGQPKRGPISPYELIESYEYDVEYPLSKVPKVILTNVVNGNIL